MNEASDNERFIRNWFFDRHVRLKGVWLRDAMNFIHKEGRGKELYDEELCHQLWELFIHSDLKDSYQPPIRIPVAAKKVVLSLNHVFQVTEAFDVSRSYYEQYREITHERDDLSWFMNGEEDEQNMHNPVKENHSPRRMLKLCLSDGTVELKAIEYGGFKQLNEKTLPGTKLLTLSRLTCRSGFMELNDRNCQVLGGECDLLFRDRAKMIAEKLNIKSPPKRVKNFIPCSNKDANTSSISPFLIRMPRNSLSTQKTHSSAYVSNNIVGEQPIIIDEFKKEATNNSFAENIEIDKKANGNIPEEQLIELTQNGCDRDETMVMPETPCQVAAPFPGVKTRSYAPRPLPVTISAKTVSMVPPTILTDTTNPMIEVSGKPTSLVSQKKSPPKKTSHETSIVAGLIARATINSSNRNMVADRQRASIAGILRRSSISMADGDLPVIEAAKPCEITPIKQSPRKEILDDTDIIPPFELEKSFRSPKQDIPIASHGAIEPYKPPTFISKKDVMNDCSSTKSSDEKKYGNKSRDRKSKGPPPGTRCITEFFAQPVHESRDEKGLLDVSQMSTGSLASPKVSLKDRLNEKALVRAASMRSATTVDSGRRSCVVETISKDKEKIHSDVNCSNVKEFKMPQLRRLESTHTFRPQTERNFNSVDTKTCNTVATVDGNLGFPGSNRASPCDSRSVQFETTYDNTPRFGQMSSPVMHYICSSPGIAEEFSTNKEYQDEEDNFNIEDFTSPDAFTDIFGNTNMPIPAHGTPPRSEVTPTVVVPVKRARMDVGDMEMKEEVESVMQSFCSNKAYMESDDLNTRHMTEFNADNELPGAGQSEVEIKPPDQTTMAVQALRNRKYWMLPKKFSLIPLFCNIPSDLRADSNRWILKILVTDESVHEVPCGVANALLERLLGFTVADCQKLSQKKDKAELMKCKRRAMQVQKSFLRLDLVLQIEMSPSVTDRPVLVDVSTLAETLKLS